MRYCECKFGKLRFEHYSLLLFTPEPWTWWMVAKPACTSKVVIHTNWSIR